MVNTVGLQETQYATVERRMSLEQPVQQQLPQWGHWLETPNTIAVYLPPGQMTVNFKAPWTLISTRFQPGQGKAAFNSDQFLPYRSEPGGFDVIPQGSYYRSVESTGHCLVLALKQPLAEHFHGFSSAEDLVLTPGQVMPSAKGKALGYALQRFYSDRLGDSLHLEALVTLALAHVSRYRSSFKPKRSPDRLTPQQLKQAIYFIHDSIDQSLTLAQLGGILNLSAHHFAHAFKATTGLPPHRYVLSCRLERAKQLLKGTDEAIATIAYSSGFGSQSHMTTVFRKQLGTTPLAYRQQSRWAMTRRR